MPAKTFNHIHLDEAGSTNEYAQELLRNGIPHKTVVSTWNQTRGKGQRENSWHSGTGLNLTFSVILLPESLPVSSHFQLNKAFSLGVLDFIRNQGVTGARVKWPNDVVASGGKIAGILTENAIRGEYISSIVAGFGININSTEFPDGFALKPVSLKNLTGRNYDLHDCLQQAVSYILKRYEQIFSDEPSLDSDYLENLYGLNTLMTYTDALGKWKGRITHVTRDGLLEIEKDNREVLRFAPQQIRVEYI